MTGWQFPYNESREEEGLADAGIETFKDAPLSGIARENTQNSMDAAAIRPEERGYKPVHVKFRLLQIDAADIPGLEQLRGSLEACLAKAKARKLKNDKTFFTNALVMANRKILPVLCIEDYETTGLKGPAEPGFPFHALVRATGVSQKSSSDAGGSFGIGKNAAFAISALHTVFYSTCYPEGRNKKQLIQGKSILVSREERGKEVRAKGYWGESGYMPVEGAAGLPAWLVREETGTTVASVGFNGATSWPAEIMESLVRNFFAAIHEDKVRFTVEWSKDKTLAVSSKIMGKLFEHEQIRQAAENNGSSENFEFASAMYAALSAPDSEVTEQTREFPCLGKMNLRILEQEGMPKRVGILRNGMYITDNLERFQEKFAKFPMSRDFVAVVQPADLKASASLREMENPRHDAFSEERIEDEKRRPGMKKDMRDLGKWIREVIRQETRDVVKEKVVLDELSDFFSSPDESEKMPDSGKAGENPEIVKVKPVVRRPKPAVGAGPVGESGSSGGKKDKGGKGGKTSGDRKGTGRGAVGGRGGKSMAISGLRNMIGGRHGRMRVISFVPEESGRARLELAAVGVSSNEALGLKRLNGEACKKTPSLDMEAGVPVDIRVELDEVYRGPVRIVLVPEAGLEELNDEN